MIDLASQFFDPLKNQERCCDGDLKLKLPGTELKKVFDDYRKDKRRARIHGVVTERDLALKLRLDHSMLRRIFANQFKKKKLSVENINFQLIDEFVRLLHASKQERARCIAALLCYLLLQQGGWKPGSDCPDWQ